MIIAAMLGTGAVPAKMICTILSAKCFFGALHYEVAFCVDGPDEWFLALDQEIT